MIDNLTEYNWWIIHIQCMATGQEEDSTKYSATYDFHLLIKEINAIVFVLIKYE